MFYQDLNYKFEPHIKTKQNTQEFPDFLVDETSEITGLLEIKAFYSSPNFDVANFEAYCDSKQR